MKTELNPISNDESTFNISKESPGDYRSLLWFIIYVNYAELLLFKLIYFWILKCFLWLYKRVFILPRTRNKEQTMGMQKSKRIKPPYSIRVEYH